MAARRWRPGARIANVPLGDGGAAGSAISASHLVGYGAYSCAGEMALLGARREALQDRAGPPPEGPASAFIANGDLRHYALGSDSDTHPGLVKGSASGSPTCLSHEEYFGAAQPPEHKGGLPGELAASWRRHRIRLMTWRVTASARARHPRSSHHEGLMMTVEVDGQDRHADEVVPGTTPSGRKNLNEAARGGSGHRPDIAAEITGRRGRQDEVMEKTLSNGRGFHAEGRQSAEVGRMAPMAKTDGRRQAIRRPGRPDPEAEQGFARWHAGASRGVTNAGCYRAGQAFKLPGSASAPRCARASIERHAPDMAGWRTALGLLHVGATIRLLMRKLIGAGTPREAVAGG